MKKTIITIALLIGTLGVIYSCTNNEVSEDEALYQDAIRKDEIKRPGNSH